MKQDRIKVLALRVQNVKSVRAADLTFDGTLQIIAGDTGQGKTTVLESIRAGLMGLDPELINNDADSADILLVLNMAKIHRLVNRDGDETLLVTDQDGNKVKQAKRFLQAIAGRDIFNPIEWVQLGGGDKKGKTERLRQQRDQLLNGIPMVLDAKRVRRMAGEIDPACAIAIDELGFESVDFEQHGLAVCNELHGLCYEHRKALNIRADDADATLKITPAPDTMPPDVSLDVLQGRAAELRKAIAVGEAADERRAAILARQGTIATRIKGRRDQIETLCDPFDPQAVEQELATAEQKRAEVRESIAELERQLADLRQQEATITMEMEGVAEAAKLHALNVQDEAAFAETESELAAIPGDGKRKENAADLDVVLGQIRDREQLDRHEKAKATAAACRAKSDVFNELVNLFRDKLPKQLLWDAELPVPGLGIDGDTVTINGVPLHLLGTSEQMRVGVMVAAHLNPDCGFILVDRAESIGQKDLRALAEAAVEHGLQLIISRVDDEAEPGPGVTVMRDGAPVS